MDREKELLFQRAASLAFGIYGQTAGDPLERQIRVGGSGVLIAPYLAITARHVLQDFRKLNSKPVREGPSHFREDHGAVLFQTNPFSRTHRSARWIVDYAWVPDWTDICLLQVAPVPENRIQHPTGFFPWSLVPPPVGKRVLMLGYPGTSVGFVDDERLSVDFNFVLQDATIIQVHELQRDRGKLNFPCFEVDKPVDSGFSGGPVFCEGKLCGLVSSDSFNNTTYVASLWPLCLLEYDYPGIGVKTSIGELFDSCVLQSSEWKLIQSCISMRTDENQRRYPFIDCGRSNLKQHQ